ncbi:MAG: hypothetical protein N3Z29_01600 [Synechococcaceae cyanobacterium MAG-AL1]|nr:hypothetical protein [Candidatus Regnicoccus frigidus MAG-AL1]
MGRSSAAERESLPAGSPLREPESAGIPGVLPPITPWSAARVAAIFQQFGQSPTPLHLVEAQGARHCLSRFWLSAPVDQLEALYRSPIGACYRLLIAGPMSAQPLLAEEERWKAELSQRILSRFDRPETFNMLLAAIPYFPRGKMRVADPLRQIPRWFLTDYATLFDPSLLQQLRQPAGLLGPSGGVPAPRPQTPHQAPAPVQQGVPPAIAPKRGNEAMALIQNKEFIGRMSGLVNLYTIDPSDAEVKRELSALRRQMGQIWLDVNRDQLQALYQTSFGQLFRNLMASGFGRETLGPEDQQVRDQLAPHVADMKKPGALAVLLAVLPFFPPGKIQFGGGEQFIPAWLLQDIASLQRPAVPSVFQ